MNPEFLAFGFVLFLHTQVQGQKRLDVMQTNLSDSEFGLCPGQEELRVSTLFNRKAMNNENLYFLIQDLYNRDIFYGSDQSGAGNCIKRFNIEAGNCGEISKPILWTSNTAVILMVWEVHSSALCTFTTLPCSHHRVTSVKRVIWELFSTVVQIKALTWHLGDDS